MVVRWRSAAVRGALLAVAGVLLAMLAGQVVQTMFERLHQRDGALAHRIFELLMMMWLGSTPLSVAVVALGWPRGAVGWQAHRLLRAAGVLAAVGLLVLANRLLLPLAWHLDLLLIRLRLEWSEPSLLASALLVDGGASVVLLLLLGARRPWRGLAVGLAPLLIRRAVYLPVRWLLLPPNHHFSGTGEMPRWMMPLMIAGSLAGVAVWGALIGLQLVAPSEPEPTPTP